jgi:hypothetical protein
MKLLLTLALVSFAFFAGNAQTKAVTESGEEVILYDDQTWAYADQEPVEAEEIPVNEAIFTVPEGSGFQIKSSKVDGGIFIDPKVWSFKKATNNEDAEFEFQLRGEDLYGMWISEEISIPLETLGTVAINNARAAATNLKVTNKEYRMVNGRKVLHIEMSGLVQGIDLTYYGYYYSDESGSSQILTYTSRQLVEKYKPVMEAFLNGFSEKEE